jgi:antirestriction protein ArdC
MSSFRAKTDAYQIVTDRILEQLEKGTVPWRKTWAAPGMEPTSLVTGKPYRGINWFLLQCAPYASPEWLTYKQAKAFGGVVKKGESGWPVFFWRTYEAENKSTGRKEVRFVARYYTVFNVAQCEGLELPRLEPRSEFVPNVSAESIVSGYDGPAIIEGPQPLYRPRTDSVEMPPATCFDDTDAYYATLFHELVHSTGHTTRLDRFGADAGHAAFGSSEYGKEELVAEMGAAFLAARTGVRGTTENSAAYIAGWLKTIRGDKRLVVTAATAAQKAVDFISGNNG